MITADIQHQDQRIDVETLPLREVVRNRPKVRELAFTLGCEIDAVVDGLLDAAARITDTTAQTTAPHLVTPDPDVSVRDRRGVSMPTIFSIAGRLTRPERIVLYLHLQEELTEPEIAERLDLPLSMVTDIIDDAFARLRVRAMEYAQL